MVLGALTRNDEHPLPDLAPSQRADFFPPLAGEHQQLDDFAVSIVRATAPNRGQFCVRQYSVARLLVASLVRANDRIDLAQPFTNRPAIECRETVARPVRGGRAAFLGNDA